MRYICPLCLREVPLDLECNLSAEDAWRQLKDYVANYNYICVCGWTIETTKEDKNRML